MAELPSGAVTFVFTDLVGSTRLWQEHAEAMRSALAHHDEILRDAVDKHGGVVVKTTGDGLHAAFESARDALAATIHAQLTLGGEDWPLPEPLRVRMGLHTGEAEIRAGDYYGPAVNKAARVSAAGHGGQILVSHATEELVRDDLPAGVGLVDLGEHRLRDLDRAERLFQVVHAGLANEFPPIRSLDAFPSNLPAQRTSFVGREREVSEVALMLSSARLVTLTGVGGVGKTRLALEVAADVLPHRSDGVWLCELAPVSEADAVVEAIASAVPGAGGESAAALSPLDALARRLSRGEALLVLDNCEHVLGAVAEIVDDLLRRCPGLSVLATSREGLGLSGELIVAVGSLAVPAADATLDTALAGDAVRLFADRATAAKHDFAVRDDNVASVLEVCRRLDGIPLAIELAAARTRVLTPAQIAERLDERFRLLTGSSRGAASRHQTLRATIDWSYDQLDDTERAVLARLAVFAGDFDLDAAVAVVAGDDVDPFAVLDTVSQLVDKSLVVASDDSETMTFRLLETIRQYAEERLDDAGEVPATRSRHAAHYIDALERAVAAGGDTLLRVATRVAPQVQAAHEWFVATGEADGALRLHAAHLSLSSVPGSSVAGTAARFTAALEIPGATRHPLAPGVLAAAATYDLASGGDPLAAYATARRSLTLADEVGVEPSPVQIVLVAATALRSGHLEEAREIALQSAAAAERTGDPRIESIAYFNVSAAESFCGDLAAAEDAGRRAEAAARRTGSDDLLAGALLMQGFALRDVEPERALGLFDEGAHLARSVSPDGQSLLYCVQNAGLVRLRFGDRLGARSGIDEALDIAERAVAHEHAAITSGHLALGLLDVGDPDDVRAAVMLLAAAEQLSSPLTLYAAVGAPADLATRFARVLDAETIADLRSRGAALDFDGTIALARAALAHVTNADGGL